MQEAGRSNPVQHSEERGNPRMPYYALRSDA